MGVNVFIPTDFHHVFLCRKPRVCDRSELTNAPLYGSSDVSF